MWRYALAVPIALFLAAGLLFVAWQIVPTESFIVRLVTGLDREATPTRCGPHDPLDPLAFIGEHVEIREILPLPDTYPFDYEWKARYRVLEVINGSYDDHEIEFFAYDHYGFPEFGNYDTVMLYLFRCGSFWIHEKYQFNPVYPTEGGGWAGCGDPYQHEPNVHRRPIQVSSFAFSPEVSFSTAGLAPAVREAKFPSRYFDYRGDKAFCVAGASPEQFLEIKRSGVLGARAAHD